MYTASLGLTSECWATGVSPQPAVACHDAFKRMPTHHARVRSIAYCRAGHAADRYQRYMLRHYVGHSDFKAVAAFGTLTAKFRTSTEKSHVIGVRPTAPRPQLNRRPSS
jgi:hypothetical protein